jgi:hypothetical protein
METESVIFKDSAKEMVDLTTTVEQQCTESLKRTVGKNEIMVRFQPDFRKEAELLMVGLESSIRETQSALDPLDIENVQLYVLHLEKLPTNYKMRRSYDGKSFYLQLFAFIAKDDLSLKECSKSDLCTAVFDTIPHELTHSALNGLISRKYTRWFNDGLAEFVASAVCAKLSPSTLTRKYASASPEVSLYRKDIRANLFGWKEPDLGMLKASQRELSNEIYYYLAAYELLQQIFNRARRNGVDNPLWLTLENLKKFSEESSKPADTDDLIRIFEENLQVNPRTIGDLDAKTKQAFIDEAISLLSNVRVTPEKKNYALYTLGCLDDVKISKEWMIFLFDQVFNGRAITENQRELAATALVVRFNQTDFDELLKAYAADNPNLKGKSIKKIKADLAQLSLRPRPQ